MSLIICNSTFDARVISKVFIYNREAIEISWAPWIRHGITMQKESTTVVSINKSDINIKTDN